MISAEWDSLFQKWDSFPSLNRLDSFPRPVILSVKLK